MRRERREQPPSGWNPYFVAFAASRGRLPEEIDDDDARENAAFIIWMNARRAEWSALRGYQRTPSGRGDTLIGPREEADFAGWLRGSAFARAEVLYAA